MIMFFLDLGASLEGSTEIGLTCRFFGQHSLKSQ